MDEKSEKTVDDSIMKDILDSGRIGYWDWSISTGYEYFSPVMKKIFGYEDNEIPNQRDSISLFVFEDDLKNAMEKFDEHVKSHGEIPFSCELRNRHKNGSTVWVLTRGKVIEWDADKNPVRMVGCNIDITDQKNSVENERNLAANLQAVLGNTNDIIASYDKERRLIIFNKAYSDIYRKLFTIDVYPGLKPSDMFSGIMQKYWETVDNRALSGETFTIEYDIPFPDGDIRAYEGSLCPIVKNGAITGFTTFTRDITERKRTERALSESEENYRTLVNNIQDAVYRCDLNGNVTFTSPSAALLLGYTDVKKLIGISIADTIYYYPEERQKFLEIMKEKGRVTDYEVTLKRSDGSPVIIQTSSHFYRDTNGEIVGIEGVYHDVTAQKLAERALRESEENYRSLVTNMQDVVYRCDLDGNLVFTTPSAARLLGYNSVDDMIGKNFATSFYYNPEDRDLFLEELTKNGKVSNYEVVLRRKDNTKVIITTNSQYYSDSRGNVIGVEGVYHDITERKQAEDALRESEEKYRSLIENMQDAVFRADLDGNITFNSPSASRILGYQTPGDIIGMNLIKDFYLNPEVRDKIQEELKNNGKLTNFEIDLKRKDGSVVKVVTNSQYSYDANGVICGFEGIYHDITEQAKAEGAIKKSEALLRSIFEASPAGIALAAGRVFTKVNNAMCVITGYSEEELIGKKTRIVYYSDEEFEKTGMVYHELEEKGIALTEARLRHKNGNEINSLLCLSPLNRNNIDEGVITTILDITNIRKAEQIINKNEALLRSLFDASPAGIALVVNRTFVKVNSTFCKITGYSQEELQNSSTRILYFSEEEYDQVRFTYNTLYKNELGMVETRYRKKDGTEIFVLLCLSPLNNGDYDAGVVATFFDITEKKRAEKQLRENQILLQSIFDASPTGILLLVNRTFTKVNNAMCLITGYSEDELCGASTRILYFNDEEFEQVGDVYLDLKSKSPGIVESRFKRKDGSEINVIICLNPIDSENIDLGVVATILDITQIKKAEQALKKNETLLQSIFNASPAGITLLNNRVLTMVNNALCTITGYSKDEILGKNARMFYFDDQEYERVGRIYKQSVYSGMVITESRFRKKDGSEINVVMSFNPLDLDDFSANVVSTLLDITELKKMEHEKQKLEEMLLHSQKLESLGRLAGGIAHDFNNMLTAILGNAELMKEYVKSSNAAYSKLEIIEGAAMSAANLTKQLLIFSRKQLIEPKILNLNDVVKNIQKMIMTLLGENIQFEIVTDSDLNEIKADSGQIEQIILNLSVNARDAMSGGGKLIIETKNTTLDEEYCKSHLNIIPGAFVMLAVTDTGAGMSKDVLDHCFEPFYTTKAKGMGTGLGLSTVYGIVNQSGGTIEVYSEIGIGTVFKLYFPVVNIEVKDDNVLTDNEKVKTGNETILIAEDNEYVLKFSMVVLQRAGYNVKSAATGEIAINIALNYREKIDLLITDVILPGMNGKEISEKLKTIHPESKILYNSGYTAEVIDKQGILDEGIHFISKPFTARQLLLKIREILDEKS
jgi:two-component system, cell cycle sensor histidine kinase and response regulator CckA